jgi:hypothetical protein
MENMLCSSELAIDAKEVVEKYDVPKEHGNPKLLQ